MAVTPEAQAAYQRSLAAYNNAVSANNRSRAEISRRSAKIKELQVKIERLNTARNRINNENGQFSNAIKPIEKGPSYDSFQGKNENNYWSSQKSHVKDEAYKFLQGVNGGGNSVDSQINREIQKLQNKIAIEQTQIHFLEMSISTPVAPTPPK